MQDLKDWTPPPFPDRDRFEGRYAIVERLDAARHGADLHRANRTDDRIWDHLPYGPFETIKDYLNWIAEAASGPDPRFHAIQDMQTGRWGGVASLMRINPAAGSIEVGHINLAPPLQKTRAATEAMFLLMSWAFEAGYRRYEWKCDAANLGSRRAAQRLGFSYEGIFRQAAVVKGRNRDTAWFAMIDGEWPRLKTAFETWLASENFDATGQQRQRLRDLTAPILAARDPLDPGPANG